MRDENRDKTLVVTFKGITDPHHHNQGYYRVRQFSILVFTVERHQRIQKFSSTMVLTQERDFVKVMCQRTDEGFNLRLESVQSREGIGPNLLRVTLSLDVFMSKWERSIIPVNTGSSKNKRKRKDQTNWKYCEKTTLRYKGKPIT